MRAAIIALTLVIGITTARAGEIVECVASPTPTRGVLWLYRDIDDRQCWFKAERGMRRGREKPKEELRWPTPAPDQIPVYANDPDPTPPPRWEVEDRWYDPFRWRSE
jgi:hypothetical protein